MTGSWLCLSLLLVGALLLGQPAWGAEEEEEEQPPLGDSQEPHGQSEEQRAPTSYEEREAMESIDEEVGGLNFAHLAMDYYNKHSENEDMYRSVAVKDTVFKDAIGTMVHMTIFLAKTDCKKEDVMDRRNMIEFYHPQMLKDHPLPELKGCNLPPPEEQENMSCRFGIFMDAREGSISVVHHKCKPLHIQEVW